MMENQQLQDKQLSQQEVEALEELKSHFVEQVKYVDEILSNKFFPMKAESEIGWIIRDNTEFDGGYQNDVIVRAFNDLKELFERSRGY